MLRLNCDDLFSRTARDAELRQRKTEVAEEGGDERQLEPASAEFNSCDTCWSVALIAYDVARFKQPIVRARLFLWNT